MDKITINLPFPNPALNPNRTKGHHWASHDTARKQAKHDGYYAALEAMGAWEPTLDEIPMTITFVMPDRRRRDRDNLLASSKATLDGIAAALGVDDNQFEPIILKRAIAKGNASMIVELQCK